MFPVTFFLWHRLYPLYYARLLNVFHFRMKIALRSNFLRARLFAGVYSLP